MSLDSNVGCYKITGVSMYYLSYPISCRGGGAKFHCTDLGGGQVFSVPMLRGVSFQCAGILEFLRPPVTDW